MRFLLFTLAAALGLLFFGVVRLRKRALKRQKKHLEEQGTQRTGELRREKKCAPSGESAAPASDDAEEEAQRDFRPAHLRGLVGDDPEFMDELLDMFLEDAPAYVQTMHTACNAADADALEHAAHSLKSSAHTFGADRLAGLCQVLEARGREGQMDDQTAALVAEAAEAFARSRAAIAAHRQLPIGRRRSYI